MEIETLQSRCYVPYSQQNAVAVVQSSENRFFAGIRIENISYPLTITAAQSALFNCLSEGDHPETLFISASDDTQLSFWQKEYDLRTDRLDPEQMSDKALADVVLSPDNGVEPLLTRLLDCAITGQSGFPVSSIVETDAGVFGGVNIECSSWSMGICAERVAVAKALANGAGKLLSIHVHTRDGEFSSPCGACRQVLQEHMPEGRIHLYHADYSHSSYYTRDLLPYSFCSSKLMNRNKKNTGE